MQTIKRVYVIFAAAAAAAAPFAEDSCCKMWVGSVSTYTYVRVWYFVNRLVVAIGMDKPVLMRLCLKVVGEID